MAFAQLETVDGQVALTIFPDALRTCGPALAAAGPVLVRGRVDETDKGRVVLVEEAVPAADLAGGSGEAAAPRLRSRRAAEEAEAGFVHACRIRVRAGAGDAAGVLQALRETCEAHPGNTPLFLHVLLPGQEVVLRAPRHPVAPGPTLVAALERLLGPRSVALDDAGRP
jgi:hypothetical protein